MDFSILKKLKKGLASITLVALLSTLYTAPVQAGNWTDEGSIPSWADEAVNALDAQGVMTGNDDGSYAPNRVLNRAEVSKIIVLATGVDIDTAGGAHFPDVNEGDWFYDYVETMYNQGWIDGYPDGTFQPGNTINRAEIAKMVVNAFEVSQNTAGAPHFSDVNTSDWFYSYVETAYNEGIMVGYGDGTFGPAEGVTRAETAVIVYEGQVVKGSVVDFDSEGTLEIEVSDYTPRGTNIPYNAVSVPYLTLDLTASSDADIEVGALTFTRLGLGDNDDFDKVWLEIDGFKVGTDKSISTDDTVQLRFNPPIVVPAGRTLTADLVGSLDYEYAADGTCYDTGADTCNIGHINRFALVSVDDVDSSAANVVGRFPLEGEEMEVANYAVSELQFTEQGSDTTVRVGDEFIEVGKFRLSNQSTNNKDIELRAITFKNQGSAELADVVENIGLYVSGELISPEVIIDGDYITFRLDNGLTGGYIMTDGDSRTFSIRGDIVSAEKNDTIKLKIDNFEDIVGVEIGTNFGVKTIDEDGNSAEDSNATLATYTLEAGDINIVRDPSSLSNQSYAPGSNDVVFLTARVTVDQPITVDGLKVHVVDSGATATIDSVSELNTDFQTFRLYINDELVDTANSFSGSSVTGAYLDFSSSMEFSKTSIVKVVGNVRDGATSGDQVRLQLQESGLDSPEYISTGETVDDDEITGSAVASYVEILNSTLEIARTDGFTYGTATDIGNADGSDTGYTQATAPTVAGETVVAGVNDVTVMKFVLDNNDSGDVVINSISFDATATGAASSNLSSMVAALYVDGQQQGSARKLDTTTNFNDISVVIPSASQREFVVVVDTVESAGGTTATATTTVSLAEVVSGSTASVTAGFDGTAAKTITVASPGLTVALADDDRILISPDGTNVTGAEYATVNNAGGYAIGYTGEILVDAINDVGTPGSFSQTHINEVLALAPASVTLTEGAASGTNSETLKVSDASVFSDGDVVSIVSSTGAGDTDGPAQGTITARDTSSTPNTITINFAGDDDDANGTFNDAGDTASEATTVLDGATVTEVTGNDNLLQLAIVNVDADNVENGKTVDVVFNGTTTELEDGTTALDGAVFGFSQSGILTVSDTTQVVNDTNLIVAGATDQEVFRLRLNAVNDDIELTDLYLLNNIDSGDLDGDGNVTTLDGTPSLSGRATFKLYNEAGALVATDTMTAGRIHFELTNTNRIRVPKDDATVITVKVDTNSVTQSDQTGARILLALDNTKGENNTGVEAVTASTGADIEDSATNDRIIDNSTDGETFVIHRTMLTFANATTQPTFTPGTDATNGLAIFRFSVTNDSAYQAVLDTMTVSISTSGAHTTTADSYKLMKYSSSSYTGTPTEVLLDGNNDGTADTTVPLAGTELRFQFFDPEEINGTVYYEIRTTITITDTASDGDSILVSFVRDTTTAIPDTVSTTHLAGITLMQDGAAVDLNGDTDMTDDGEAALSANTIWSDRSNNGGIGAFLNGYELIFPSVSAGARE